MVTERKERIRSHRVDSAINVFRIRSVDKY